MKKAQYLITCKELPLQMATVNELSPQRVRSLLLPKPKKKVSNASPERRWMHCMKKTAESVALFVVTIFSAPVMWCWQKVPTASWLSVTG